MTHIFISYAREDEGFARRVREGLTSHRHKVWIDRERILPSAEFPREIKDAIAGAESVVFVISPNSASSRMCGEEVRWAREFQKRLIPVVCSEADPRGLPQAVANRQWIEFEDFDAGLLELNAAIGRDPDQVRQHARLLVRAREWADSGRDSSRLLYGSDLAAAEGFLVSATVDEPVTEAETETLPTPIMHEYVGAGHKRAARRQRSVLTAVFVVLGITIALAIVAWIQLQRAEKLTRVTQSNLESQEGRAEFESDPLRGLELARRGWRNASREGADSGGNLARVMAELAAQARVRSLGRDVIGVFQEPGGRFLAVENRSQPGEILRSGDLTSVARLHGQPLGAPRTVRSDAAYLTLEVQKDRGKTIEVRRCADMTLIGGARKNLRLVPPDFPTIALFDSGGPHISVVRLADGVELWQPEFDSKPYYEPGWPFLVLRYRDYDNDVVPPPPDLVDLKTAEVRETFTGGFERFVVPRSTRSPYFVVVLPGQAPRLARTNDPKPIADSRKLPVTEETGTLAFSQDEGATWLLVRDVDAMRLIRTADAAVVDTWNHSTYEVLPGPVSASWVVARGFREKLILEVAGDRLVEKPYLDPPAGAPAPTTPEPHRERGIRAEAD